jgi:hypothetical protein
MRIPTSPTRPTRRWAAGVVLTSTAALLTLQMTVSPAAQAAPPSHATCKPDKTHGSKVCPPPPVPTYTALGNGAPAPLYAGQTTTVTVTCDPGDTPVSGTEQLIATPLRQDGGTAHVTAVEPLTVGDRHGVTLTVVGDGPGPVEVRATLTCQDTNGDHP